jgi:tetratricopeptide (TPR) repeat protein
MPGKMPRMWHFLVFAFLSGVSLPGQPVTPEDFLARAREHFERRRFLNTLDSLRVVLELTAAEDARNNRTKLEAEILAAQSLAALGRREEAANMYERAIAHGYADKSALAYLGNYFEARGQWQKAREYLAAYFNTDKGDAETHIRYAVVLARLKERVQAKELLSAIEPPAGGRKAEECEIFERQKKLRQAFDCFWQYRNSHPDREVAYLALYRISRQLGDRTKQLELAQTLYWLFGDDTRYVWPLIEVRLAERRFYAARLLLEEVIRVKGTDSDAERLLANLQRDAPEAMKKPFRATASEMRLLREMER